MKNDGAIKHKLKQVQFRHTKKEIEGLLSPSPSNCKFNVLNSSGFYQCSLSSTAITICDSQYQGNIVATNCSTFVSKYNKEDIKKSLSNFFSVSDIPTIARRYPDMAALLWVLDESEDRSEIISDEEETAKINIEDSQPTNLENLALLPSLTLHDPTPLDDNSWSSIFYNILLKLKLVPKFLGVQWE
jgi:hypothetical protein